jgi:predicted N-acyltransferase
MTISVERFEAIADRDRAAWDRLAANDTFASSGWLKTMEETALLRRSVYFVARRASQLVAAAPCYLQEAVPAVSGMDGVVFGRFTKLARALGINVSPALVCGTSIGLSGHVLIAPDTSPEERRRLTLDVIDAMERFAQQQGVTLCFRNVVDRDAWLPGTLEGRGYLRATEMPTTVMDVAWTSFSGYLRDLKREHPATAENVRREVNRAHKGGIVFRKVVDGIACAPRLLALLDAHNRRLNGAPFPFRPAFLEVLQRYLGDKLVVYVALDGDDPIGVSLGVRAGDAIFLPMVGVDVTRGRETFVYFNNSYRMPIEDAIATGIRRIYCGKLVYDVKLRRGFRLLDLSAYFRVPNRLHAALLAPVVAAQSVRIRRMLERVRTAAAGRSAR